MMKMRSYWLVLAVVGGCKNAAPTPAVEPEQVTGQPAPQAAPSAQAASSFACGNLRINFGEPILEDVNLGNQTDANCYAWQEFIALNWPATGGSFGAPGDQSALRWQGYMNVRQLFQPGAQPPPPWGTPPQFTPECLNEARLTEAQARTVQPLVNATKFSSEFLAKADSAEAFPRGAPAWLGDANDKNVWFEVRVNEDEYDFVVQNHFYDAQKQLAFYTSQNPVAMPLQLPAGCIGPTSTCPATQTGAMELKAAWMEVPNPGDSKWNNYKLSSAVVVDPATQKCEQVTVALVAFHIIHKTQSQPTWIWATFEHTNNAPNANGPGDQSWNFYNPQCSTETVQVPTACQYKKQATVSTSCTPNAPPQYEIGDGCPAPTPTQVTRVNPIDPTAANVNETVQTAIENAFSGSVWQNYMLVNVVWSTNPPVIPPGCKTGNPGCQSIKTPQLTQSLNPSGAVANTVLETYIQDHEPSNPFAKSNCISCHQYASVPGAPTATPFAADFSFALGLAQSPGTSPDAPSPTVKSRASRPGEPRKIRRVFR